MRFNYLQVTQFVILLTLATLNSSEGNEMCLPDRTKIEIKEFESELLPKFGRKTRETKCAGYGVRYTQKKSITSRLYWSTVVNFLLLSDLQLLFDPVGSSSSCAINPSATLSSNRTTLNVQTGLFLR